MESYQGSTQVHAVEDVRHYPRPPKLESAAYPIRISLAEQTIASTDRAYRVLETFHAPTYYIPLEDVDMQFLSPIKRRSICEWKGPAKYFNVRVDGALREAAAWHYPDPFEPFVTIADYLAFYCHAMDDCLVDGVKAEPQPGNFYGGWVTPWITGPVKGAPGTNHW